MPLKEEIWVKKPDFSHFRRTRPTKLLRRQHLRLNNAPSPKSLSRKFRQEMQLRLSFQALNNNPKPRIRGVEIISSRISTYSKQINKEANKQTKNHRSILVFKLMERVKGRVMTDLLVSQMKLISAHFNDFNFLKATDNILVFSKLPPLQLKLCMCDYT